MASEIHDQLYINQIEKIIRRKLTRAEMAEIDIEGEFELKIGRQCFVVEVPKYSFPYDLIDSTDMASIYSVPYRDIVRKTIANGDGTFRSKYSYPEMMTLRLEQGSYGKDKTGEAYIAFLHLLAEAKGKK
jgi:hypothetical protein